MMLLFCQSIGLANCLVHALHGHTNIQSNNMPVVCRTLPSIFIIHNSHITKSALFIDMTHP